MHYVYLIQSLSFPDQIYIGCTQNIDQRLMHHNSGKSPHTNKFKPWKIIVYLGFAYKSCAIEFERYLKSGSGRAFITKRFLSFTQ